MFQFTYLKFLQNRNHIALQSHLVLIIYFLVLCLDGYNYVYDSMKPLVKFAKLFVCILNRDILRGIVPFRLKRYVRKIQKPNAIVAYGEILRLNLLSSGALNSKNL